jgi:hypothetical protein
MSGLDIVPRLATIAPQRAKSAVDKFIVQEYGQDKTLLLGETLPHENPNTIQLEVWRRVVDESGKPTGRVVRVAGRPIPEIMRDLDRRLTAEDLIDEYFALGQPYQYDHARRPHTPLDWPDRYRWIACYACTGGSEGHYVNVDLITENGKEGKEADWVRNALAVIKTFRGMEHAQKIAARCAALLGA